VKRSRVLSREEGGTCNHTFRFFYALRKLYCLRKVPAEIWKLSDSMKTTRELLAM
jgi:hypothetical protein